MVILSIVGCAFVTFGQLFKGLYSGGICYFY